MVVDWGKCSVGFWEDVKTGEVEQKGFQDSYKTR